MAVQTQAAARPFDLLRRSLQVDAVLCADVGLGAALFALPLSSLLGIPTLALVVVGVALIAFAALLWFGASRPTVDRRIGWVSVIAGTLWVIDSALLLIFNPLPLTTLGWWVVLIVAVVVAALAEAQFIGLRRAAQ